MQVNIHIDGDHERVGREVGIHRYPVIHTTADWTIDAMESGMQSGRTSLMVFVPATFEAKPVLIAAEISLNAYMMAASSLRAHFKHEVEAPGFARMSEPTRALLAPRFAEAIRRVIPDTTAEQASELAEMFIDGLGAGE